MSSATYQRGSATGNIFCSESHKRAVAQEPAASLPQQTKIFGATNPTHFTWNNFSRKCQPLLTGKATENKISVPRELCSVSHPLQKQPSRKAKCCVFYLNTSMAFPGGNCTTSSQESTPTDFPFHSSAMLLFYRHKDEGTSLMHRKATAVAASPAEMHLFLKLIPCTPQRVLQA